MELENTHKKLSHDSNKSNLFWYYFGTIIAILIIAGPSLSKIGQQFFQLTPTDVKMIPVGVFAFLLFWRFNEKFVFPNALKLVEKREQATDGNFSESERLIEETKSINEKVLYTVRKNQLEANAKKESLVAVAKKNADEEIAQIIESQKLELETARKTIQNKISQLEQNLESKVDSFANDIANNILNCKQKLS